MIQMTGIKSRANPFQQEKQKKNYHYLHSQWIWMRGGGWSFGKSGIFNRKRWFSTDERKWHINQSICAVNTVATRRNSNSWNLWLRASTVSIPVEVLCCAFLCKGMKTTFAIASKQIFLWKICTEGIFGEVRRVVEISWNCFVSEFIFGR